MRMFASILHNIHCVVVSLLPANTGVVCVNVDTVNCFGWPCSAQATVTRTSLTP